MGKVYAFPTGRLLTDDEISKLQIRGSEQRGVCADAALYLSMLRADAPENAGDAFKLPPEPLDAYDLGIQHAQKALSHAMTAHGVPL